MKETEIANYILAWLNKKCPTWTIFQEVSPLSIYENHVADIVCVKDIEQVNGKKERLVWIIETKTSLSLKVIRQAYEWDVDYRSVAVPKVKSKTAREDRRWWYSRLYHELKIGSIHVSEYGDVYQYKLPPYHSVKRDDTYSHKYQILKTIDSGLLKFGESKAGSGDGGYATVYKYSMVKIQDFLEENPGSTSREIVEELGSLHYSSKDSARSAITQSLQKFENDWCRTQRNSREYRFYIKENIE